MDSNKIGKTVTASSHWFISISVAPTVKTFSGLSGASATARRDAPLQRFRGFSLTEQYYAQIGCSCGMVGNMTQPFSVKAFRVDQIPFRQTTVRLREERQDLAYNLVLGVLNGHFPIFAPCILSLDGATREPAPALPGPWSG